jgi:hypothetical protein
MTACFAGRTRKQKHWCCRSEPTAEVETGHRSQRPVDRMAHPLELRRHRTFRPSLSPHRVPRPCVALAHGRGFASADSMAFVRPATSLASTCSTSWGEFGSVPPELASGAAFVDREAQEHVFAHLAQQKQATQGRRRQRKGSTIAPRAFL